tara:strand:- start:114 stop:230 length:117 start_codon:yes stop_codon:yes gene_type:complete
LQAKEDILKGRVDILIKVDRWVKSFKLPVALGELKVKK